MREKKESEPNEEGREEARGIASSEFASVAEDFKKLSQQARDPVLLAALLNRLTQERSASNLVLKEINRKLEKLGELEARIARVEEILKTRKQHEVFPEKPEEPLLPEIDEEILGFVKKKKRATAQEVQARFHYKGSNAASARLNNLCRLGLLEKRQVGRKVFFIPFIPR